MIMKQGHQRTEESSNGKTTEETPTAKGRLDQTPISDSHEEPTKGKPSGGGDPVFRKVEKEDSDSRANERCDDTGE